DGLRLLKTVQSVQRLLECLVGLPVAIMIILRGLQTLLGFPVDTTRLATCVEQGVALARYPLEQTITIGGCQFAGNPCQGFAQVRAGMLHGFQAAAPTLVYPEQTGNPGMLGTAGALGGEFEAQQLREGVFSLFAFESRIVDAEFATRLGKKGFAQGVVSPAAFE